MLEKVLHYFEEISKIPHGSGNTKAISDFCVNFAKERCLECYQDDQNNVIIKKKGNRDANPLILQGHLDMVCEKESDIDFDFIKDSLKLKRDDHYLSALGTTLGADDGIAVAMCLAILDSDDINHPNLEVVFTTDEETGMFGAAALDMTKLKSKRLLNIDSEVEGVLTAGCAGGARVELSLPIKPQYIPYTGDDDNDCFRITVTGLIGGHSGIEIDKGRLNSNIVMGDFLLYLLENDFNIRLIDINGGTADNVIPNETSAVIFSSYEGEVAISADIRSLAAAFVEEYGSDRDPDLIIAVEQIAPPHENGLTMMLGTSDTERCIEFLNAVPNGIISMSKDISGLVETSLNLGQLNLTADTLKARFSVRSSVNDEKTKLIERLGKVAKEYGGFFTDDGYYPAWEYRKESKFRDSVISSYKKVYINEPKVVAIHAGLECGLFCEKMPELDCVSIGPNIKDIHTPKERLDLASTKRTIDFVLKILETI